MKSIMDKKENKLRYENDYFFKKMLFQRVT